MRSAGLPALLVLGVLAGCTEAPPFDIQAETTTTPQLAAVPGTGNPAIDQQLQAFNNEVVRCANAGELDRQRASQFALLTSILRFTPTPPQKLDALTGALLLQIEHARTRGDVSESCAASLTGMLEDIRAG